ncbi:MAG: type II toxin-antitoxin system prevent-host-death family antitoxin [Bifidobacteriaceae bacterium]|jgi:prevent-host-death family protein|nr:type II toxin-antitoxin system prevent-host-death family antitoxin [Bifidobacteriaceae bacterium]
MSHQVNVQEAKASLSRLLVEAEQGTEVLIARRGQPVVKLTPLPDRTRRVLGFIPGEVEHEVLAPVASSELEAWG